MSNVVDMFNTPARVNAKATIQGRVEELDEDDAHTDALVITFGSDGLTIRSTLAAMLTFSCCYRWYSRRLLTCTCTRRTRSDY